MMVVTSRYRMNTNWNSKSHHAYSFSSLEPHLEIFQIVRIFRCEIHVSLTAEAKECKEQFDYDEIGHFKAT